MVAVVLTLIAVDNVVASGKETAEVVPFLRSLNSYGDENLACIMALSKNRIQQEHFTLVAT